MTGGDAARQLRFVSYGGGVQSTALLVLAAQGRVDFTTFVMANVGDDSEMPATLRYVRDVAAPFAEAHGIDLHLIDRHRRDGTVETLYGRLTKDGSRSLPIPVRMSNGAPGSRSCTADFKIRVTDKWAKQHGATRQQPAVVGIGISADEVHRANNRRVEPHERVVYPLISVGDDTGLRLNRADCARLIQRAGLPVPPKSSCYFCPFHRLEVWTRWRAPSRPCSPKPPTWKTPSTGDATHSARTTSTSPDSADRCASSRAPTSRHCPSSPTTRTRPSSATATRAGA